MFDDGQLLVFSSSDMCMMLLDPGREVPAGFHDVYLAAFTWDVVYSGVTAGWSLVLVGEKLVCNLLGVE